MTKLIAVFVCLCYLLVAPLQTRAATGHEFTRAFGPDCTAATHFEIPGPVAVDQGTHDVYVADQGTGSVVRCTAAGAKALFTAGPGSGTNAIAGFSFVNFQALNQIAVNATSHDFYVLDAESHSVKGFHQDGEPLTFSSIPGSPTAISGLGEACGVAVDQNGDIYTSAYTGTVRVFTPTGLEVTSFAANQPCNLAVDSTGAVYAAGYSFTAPGITKYLPSVFPVTAATTYKPDPSVGGGTGIVASNFFFGVAVDPSNNDVYGVDHPIPGVEVGQVDQYDAAGAQLGSFGGPGEEGELVWSEGLAVDAASGNVYVSTLDEAAPEKSQVELFSPPPPEPPEVVSTIAASITATSVAFEAQVNPRLQDTHFKFEYLTESQYLINGENFAGALKTPLTDLGSSGKPQIAKAHVGGLQPNTAYKFQVVAESIGGSKTGAATAFSTFPVVDLGLPDGRAYELVSPPEKSGEVIPQDPIHSLSGSCEACLPGIGYLQAMPMQATPDGSSVAYMGQAFAGGLASGANEYVASRGPGGWSTHSIGSPLFGVSRGEGYVGLSPDLSTGIAYQISPVLSPSAPTRGGQAFANLYLQRNGGQFQPLVSTEPPAREPGKYAAGSPATNKRFNIVFAGANSGSTGHPAFSDVIFEANDALVAADPPLAPAAPTVGGEETNLYVSAEGLLRLVNVLPGNVTAAPGAVLGSGQLLGNATEYEAPNRSNAISADGETIFWSQEATGKIFARLNGDRTLEIPSPGSCRLATPPSERTCFLTASQTGTEVLLSNGTLLHLSNDQKEFEVSGDLSSGEGGFQGILGTASDLSYIYFVDTKALAGVGSGPRGEVPALNAFNLYVWHQGVTHFIGRLAATDRAFGNNARYGTWKAAPSNRVAQVSPDGSILTFDSAARLTGYNSDSSGGVRCSDVFNVTAACPEVFEYNASASTLVCASCNPTGSRPLGPSLLTLIFTFNGLPPFPQPRNLTNGGVIFFESQDALTPADTNGNIQDVYEWKPAGIGGCARPTGCISLISTGRSPNDSFFINATPSGSDVFMVTRQRLVSEDANEQLDLYDARVGGGSASADPRPCLGDSCRGPAPVPSVEGAPGSAEFSGPSNPKPKNSKHHQKKKHNKGKSGKQHKGRAAKHRQGSGK